jgi:hypothetical protein
MVDFSGTFDTTNALSGIFLWVIFGYFTAVLNCDLQRMMRSNPIVVHIMGLTAFFFLFTLLDSNNKNSVAVIYAKTIFVYLLFIMMTKSKWYFVVPVLVMLLVDQTFKKHLAMQEATNTNTSTNTNMEKQRAIQHQVTTVLNVAIIAVIIIGTLHYMYLQYLEYGPRKFSLYTFFFGLSNKCKNTMPNYDRFRLSK